MSNHNEYREDGHYTAHRKLADGKWWKFDDDVVSIVENANSSVVGTSAYVLFYQQRQIA